MGRGDRVQGGAAAGGGEGPRPGGRRAPGCDGGDLLAAEARFLADHRARFDPALPFVRAPAAAEAPVAALPLTHDLLADALDDVVRLLRTGDPGGPTVEDALALLGALRASRAEQRAVDELLRRHARRPLPPAVRLACADSLAARAERARAFAVVAEALGDELRAARAPERPRALAGSPLAPEPPDFPALARSLEGRLLVGPEVEVEVDGARRILVLGDEVGIGRSCGGVRIRSPFVSRTHLVLRRVSRLPVVDVVGGRTERVDGDAVSGRLVVDAGISLRLGGVVPLGVRPADRLDPRGDLLVDVGGALFHVPLGPAALGGADVTLERAGGVSWLVLRGLPGESWSLHGRRVTPPLVLCDGDLVARDGGPALRFARAGLGP